MTRTIAMLLAFALGGLCSAEGRLGDTVATETQSQRDGAAQAQEVKTPPDRNGNTKASQQQAAGPMGRDKNAVRQPSVPARTGTVTNQKARFGSKKWHVILTLAAIGAAGGYLVSDGSTGRRVGGGVVIGLDGVLACVVFVPGCSR